MTRNVTQVLAALSLVALVASSVVAERGDPRNTSRATADAAERVPALPPSQVGSETPDDVATPVRQLSVEAPVAAFSIGWWSVNGGGVTNVTGANFGLGLSVGQAAAGYVTGTNYNLGMGFWYGTATACPITLAGDVDGSSSISPADIVYVVNMIFKAGPDALPCLAAADVDCSGNISSGDIIYMVNSIFKAGPPPCNTCLSTLAAGC